MWVMWECTVAEEGDPVRNKDINKMKTLISYHEAHYNYTAITYLEWIRIPDAVAEHAARVPQSQSAPVLGVVAQFHAHAAHAPRPVTGKGRRRDEGR